MEHESTIRLISFALVFIVLALWEVLMPCRSLTTSKRWRWLKYLGKGIWNPKPSLISITNLPKTF